MKTQIYPEKYVHALQQLAAAGQSLAHALERRNTTDPALVTLLGIHADRTEKFNAAYREVVDENAAIRRATEASVAAVNAEFEATR